MRNILGLLMVLCFFAGATSADEQPSLVAVRVQPGIDRVLPIASEPVSGSESVRDFAQRFTLPENASSVTIFATPADQNFVGSVVTVSGEVGAVFWKEDGSLQELRLLKSASHQTSTAPAEMPSVTDLFSVLRGFALRGATSLVLDYESGRLIRVTPVSVDLRASPEETQILSSLQMPQGAVSTSVALTTRTATPNAVSGALLLANGTTESVEWSIKNGEMATRKSFVLAKERVPEILYARFRGRNPALYPEETAASNRQFAQQFKMVIISVAGIFVLVCTVLGIVIYRSEKKQAQSETKRKSIFFGPFSAN